MKKKLGIVLALLIALSLVACGKDTGESSKESQARSDAPLEREDNSSKTKESSEAKTEAENQSEAQASMEGAGFSSMTDIQSATDVVWGKQDDATRADIIAAAQAEGMEVSFGDDGSMTIVDTDGTVFVQNPDGSWASRDEDGTINQLGGSWPDNEFTRLVPKPDFALAGLSSSGDEFTAVFQGIGVEQIKEYAEKVKAMGFTIDAEEQDQNVYGIVVYNYSAYNDDGYQVEVSFTSGTSGLTIRK
ncbi:MAG: hypothetical protein II477_08475 [Lachnospiraceae bacterium]|nr:hypothetical protein [Lachnospiraceae bacterium]